MQVVHFTDTRVGSLDWELPPHVAKTIGTLPQEERDMMLEDLTSLVRAYLLMLSASLAIGPMAVETLRAGNVLTGSTLKKLAEAQQQNPDLGL